MESTFEEGTGCLYRHMWLDATVILINIFFVFTRVIDYQKTLEFFKSKSVDVAICDHFTASCQEACHTLQIPL